jgi:uncharacterized protein YndB with AHSA1/START domain
MITTTTVDKATHTIHFERVLNDSLENVFDAWTHADAISAWWDPRGIPLASCTIDLRVGGTFAFVNDGHSPPFTGTYVTIERPSKLVFEALGAVGTVLLEAKGDRETLMRVAIRCASADHLAQFVEMGAAQGTARTFENLAAFVGQVRS